MRIFKRVYCTLAYNNIPIITIPNNISIPLIKYLPKFYNNNYNSNHSNYNNDYDYDNEYENDWKRNKIYCY